MKSFIPPWYLRSPALQTVLNSSHLRNPGIGAMERAAQQEIIETSQGTKLLLFVSRQDTADRGTVLLLHGWEGSSNSAYIVNTGRYLYDAGFSVVRLNLRDHGPTHHLNEGLFYATLLDEVLSAVEIIASRFAQGGLCMAGYSMGANFVLRIAREAAKKPDRHLRHLVAVNPPLDPLEATRRIDASPSLRKYFLSKWKRSLVKKEEIFPRKYHLADILALDSCYEITDILVKRYAGYDGADDYFRGYSIDDRDLEKVTVPLTILMSRDDPVIAHEGFSSLKVSPSVNLIIERFGGHCGYITGPRLRSWYQPLMLDLFSR